MGNVSRRFDSAKNELRELSNTKPRNVRLPKMETTGGIFGWGNHYVHGDEMNDYTRQLQTGLSEMNENIRRAFQLSGVMFQLSDALETDYIAKTQRSLDEALESGRKAMEAAKDAKRASMEASAAQKTANGSIEVLKKSLAALQRTNDRLEEFRRKAEDDIRDLESRLARTQGGGASVSSPRSIGPIIAIAIIGTISLVHLILDICGVL